MGVEDFDQDLYDLIEELIASGELEAGTKEYGVAQQVMTSGYESLSPKQRVVYDKGVVPLLEQQIKDDEANQSLDPD